MSKLLRISPRAHEDIQSIYNYVRKDGEGIAQKQLRHIYSEIENLAQFPEMGIPLQKFVIRKTSFRLLIVRKVYIVVYNLTENTVDILRVFRKEQDFITALGLGTVDDS